MGKFSTGIAVLTLAIVPASWALAQDQQPAESPEAAPQTSSRYQLRKHEDGFLRLDTETGAVSLCKVAETGLICRVGAGEREAYVEALNSMQQQLDELRDRLDIVETHIALRQDGEAEPQAQVETDQPEDESSNDEIIPGSDLAEREIDRAVEFTQKAMRRLFEAVQDLKKEMEEENEDEDEDEE